MQLNKDMLSEFSGKEENPKKLATYVVAFALKGTYEDLVTAQQMICNKRSPQASTNSITPTNSLKLLDSVHTLKSEQTTDPPANNDKVVEDNKAIDTNSPNFESNNSESNIEDEDQNKVISFIETDETTDSSNDENENVKNVPDTENAADTETPDQPEVIFNAINYAQRKNSKFRKYQRKSKTQKIITPKCNKFKCKAPKNSISSRLEKYYDKTKQNHNSSGYIQEGFSNISRVVSRTRVLKNGLAKENLLDDTKLTISNDLLNQFNDNDDGSQCYYPSTAKNDSFVSNSSGKTLTHVSRTSSKDADLYSVDTIKSVIEMSPETPPYKSDVINVAVAVAYKKSKNSAIDEKLLSSEKYMHLTSLTSQSEPITMELGKLTSQVPSNFEPIHPLNSVNSRKKSAHTKEMSNATLVNIRSSFDVSSDDTFDMARTSSDFNESTNSTSTLKKEKEFDQNREGNEFKLNETQSKRQQSILETVINLGYYPDVTPSTSSGVAVTVVDYKDVFVTDTNQNYHVCSKNMGDHRKENNINSNIFKKQFNERDISPTKKPVNLPNHDEIRELLTNGIPQTKHPDESKPPFNFPEMWDKLIVVLDVAFKRLETTITEKIIRELKNTIASLELRAQPIPEVDMDLEKSDIVVIEPPSQEMDSTQGFKDSDRSLQCNLVQSEVIDKIMQTLSTQGPKVVEPGRSVRSLQKLKSRLIREYLEVLKPPLVVGPELLEDNGDTVTISTVRTETFGRIHRLRMIFFGPIRFIRENLFVIASVPAFFVVLLFVYGVLMLLIKPL